MKETIIKYIDYKIRLVSKKLQIEEFSELKDLENFLNILMDVQDKLGPEEVDKLNKNRNLLKKINEKYKIFNDDTLGLFIDYIKALSRHDPSFVSKNYSYLLNCVDAMVGKVDLLYKRYEKLFKVVKQKELENEDLVLHKMWLEELKNKLENDMIISDTALVDFILMDKQIDDNYKLRLFSSIERYNRKAIKEYMPASYEEIRKLLEDYGYSVDSKHDLLLISANYRLLTLNKILETIKILDLKFSDDILTKILVLGTSVNTIKEAYKKIINDKKYSLIATLKIHNFWIDKSHRANFFGKDKSSILDIKDNSESSNSNDESSNEEYEPNSSEIFETAKYLEKFPFYNSSFNGMKSILKLPVVKLMKRENMLGLYGISANDINGSMTLYSPYIITLLDQFIELDLKDYILSHLSTLSKPKSLPIVIYNNKIKHKKITRHVKGSEYLLPEIVEAAINYKDVIQVSNLTGLNVKKRTLYDEKILVDEPDKIVPKIYNLPIIKYLEENYKINELQYKIGDYIFSRKKILRVISSFCDEKEISMDLFLYVMTYQRIIDKIEADDLEKCLRETYNLSKGYSI